MLGESVTKPTLSGSLLKSPILRDKCWIKGKITLLRKPATLERQRLGSQRTKSPGLLRDYPGKRGRSYV